jgi:hypothetical protein
MHENLIVVVFVVCLSLPGITVHAQSPICNPPESPKSYVGFKKMVDAEIKTFANKKEIAKRADTTLSKLISAKSPAVTSWMSKRNLNTKTEDEIIREWRDYFTRNFILTKYPQDDAVVNAEIEKLMNSIGRKFKTKDLEKNMERYFSKSKQAALAYIKSLDLSESQQKQIISRIQSIQLYWLKNFKGSKYQQLPLDFLDWGIAYDPAANEINIGVNALSYPNEETYIAVILHEIGHSIDSCRWSAYFEQAWPFAHVGECLRSSLSVGAKKRDDSQLDALVKQGKIGVELSASLKANTTCNKLSYPPVGLQADQLPETFADWFSAEVLSTMKGLHFSDIRKDLCEKKELSDGSSYVSNEARLAGIYFVQPQLKGKRESPYRYCSFKTELVETKN